MTNWRNVPFHTLFHRLQKRTGFPDEELLSVYRDYGVIRKSDRDDNFNRPGDLSDYQLVERGDLVLNKMKTWQGSLGISPHRGIVSPAYFVYKPVSQNDERFLHYALRCRDAIDYYASHSTGIRVNQWDLSPEWLDVMPVALPDLETQRRIADYLDKEISEMDAMIEEFEGLVKSLLLRKPKKVAQVLSQEHHPTIPLGLICSLTSGDFIPLSEVDPEYDLPVFGGNGVLGRTHTGNIDEDCLLVGRVGALCGNVHWAHAPAFITDNALIVQPKLPVDLTWLEHSLRSLNLGKLSQSSAQPVIAASKVLRERISFPPIDKQREIADELDRETAKMDALIEESTRLTENLKARKTALITEVVTGRKEV